MTISLRLLRFAFLWMGVFFWNNLAAQENNGPAITPDERLFVESKWRYTYTLEAESNTVIHKADKDYDYYLYFRYDYTYQEFYNGKMTRGNWSLNGRTLFYSFQHVNKFEIVQLNKSVLVLEFTQRNSKGTYQYHFVRVDSKMHLSSSPTTNCRKSSSKLKIRLPLNRRRINGAGCLLAKNA